MLFTLLLTCAPAVVLRGDRVECQARLDPDAPFTVVERIARAEGHVLRDDRDPSPIWAGIAAVDTEVEMTVRAGERLLTARSRFAVRSRPFPPLRLPPQPPEAQPGDDGLAGSFTLSLEAPRTLYVEDGPDAQWFIVAEPVPAPRATLRVHGGLPPEVQRNVLRHEGAHYRESRRSLEERDLQREIEDLHVFYAEAMAGDPLHERVRRKLQSFLDGIHDEQQLTVDEAMPIHMRLP